MNTLPIEIMNEIFNYIDGYDLWMTMPRVCKWFHRCIEYRNDNLSTTQIYMLTLLVEKHETLFDEMFYGVMAKNNEHGILSNNNICGCVDDIWVCDISGCHNIFCRSCLENDECGICGLCEDITCAMHTFLNDECCTICINCYKKNKID